jgi:membrane fusion protein, multidrug efflux system
LIAACILAGGGYLYSRSTSNKAAPQKSQGQAQRGGVPVSVATVTRGNMGVYISAIGTVTPVYTVAVTSRVAGQLTEIHYKEGQIVNTGDLLAVIDPRPYAAAYEQAAGQLARDQAALANAKIDLQRYTAALAQHAIPEQTYATQQATVSQDEATIKLDQGNLAAAKVNLDYTRISSPITGRVGLRQTDLGNIVQANGTTPLLTITQMQPITVIFTMAEDYISEVYSQVRAEHPLRVDALDREDQHEIAQGNLLTLDNQVDTTTGTVRVRASFDNEHYELFPNEFVNTRLLVRTLTGVSIIPNAAIQRNNEQAYVYVVNRSDNTVQTRDVTVTASNPSSDAVTGVKPGETVVTDGFDRLENGAKVTVRQETGTAPAAAPAQKTGARQTIPSGAANTQLNTNTRQQPAPSTPNK